MKFESIAQCLESYQDGYSFSDAVLDAINASRQSKETLEKLFDSQLWVGEDFEFDNEEDKRYYITLSHIEESLVHSGLIYNN